MTRLSEEFRKRLAHYQLIVPSPMTARHGHRKSDGKLSAHTLDNTGPRRFLVVEFDKGETSDHASLLWELAIRAQMVLAVHSGGKSLHGWFWCASRQEDQTREFMRQSVRLGADPATWTRSQFVRMPGAMRDNGNRQSVLYFNPQLAA